MLKKNEIRIYSYLAIILFIAVVFMFGMSDYYHVDAKSMEEDAELVYVSDKRIDKEMIISVVSEKGFSEVGTLEDAIDLIVRDQSLWNLIRTDSGYYARYYKAISGKYYLDEITSLPTNE